MTSLLVNLATAQTLIFVFRPNVNNRISVDLFLNEKVKVKIEELQNLIKI